MPNVPSTKKSSKATATTSGATRPTQPSAPVALPTDLFTQLGLHGLGPLAPVLLAALATEEPLLLIGPHGTAKTLLLTRIADALGLSARHYNASLLNFDDLVGFPLPGKDGTLEYIKTPAAIWGAGAVIFDEISRCRPDIQNKLFPIIHERKVQGLPLFNLRYRWSAMNPPATDDVDNGYVGSEPLDAALADRFAYVVAVPEWNSLTETQQLAVITATDAPVPEHVAAALQNAIAHTRTVRATIDAESVSRVAGYVRTVALLLAQAGLTLSPRRQGMLHRAILAVQAAATVIDATLTPADAALLALTTGIPQRAQGIKIDTTKVIAAHREAWRLFAIDPLNPLRAIILTPDPCERIRLACDTTALSGSDFSTVVADSLAQLTPGARAAATVHLFESENCGRLNAAIADQIAASYQAMIVTQHYAEVLHTGNPRRAAWVRLQELLATLNPNAARDQIRANAAVRAFAANELHSREDSERFFSDFGRVLRRFARAA